MISRRVEAPCSCQCAVCAPLPAEEVLLGRMTPHWGGKKRTGDFRSGLSQRTFVHPERAQLSPRVSGVVVAAATSLSLSLSLYLCVCVCRCVHARASSAHRRPALQSADTPGGQSALGSPCHWTICGYKGRSAQIGGDTLVESAACDLLHENR